jgi:large subunit ribosomal protein L19
LYINRKGGTIMDIIKSIEHEQMKNKIPQLKVGDTVKVHVRVKEGSRERIQVFEGIIIKIQGGGLNQTFTVRRISYGVGVEKTFLIHSPKVEKVEVIRIGKARRAKLLYLRDRLGKSAKTKEKIGAKIETNEIIIKEELSEEVATEEEIEVVVTEEKVEVVAETPAEPVAEAKEPKAEESKEEAPAVETETPVVEEVTDTVSEEKVEEVKEEPVKRD